MVGVMNKEEAAMAAEQWDRAMTRQRIDTLEGERLDLLRLFDALRHALADAEAAKATLQRQRDQAEMIVHRQSDVIRSLERRLARYEPNHEEVVG